MAKMSAQDWMSEINRGLAYRKLFAYEAAWRKNELNFYNDPAGHAARGPNLVFEQGDTILSSTGALDPEFTVVPTHPAGVSRAPLVESLDNTLHRQMRLRKHVHRACLNSYLYGKAIIKIGYDSEFGWNPTYALRDGSMSLTQLHQTRGTRIENKNVQPGMPWVGACAPHDIVVPWGTVDVEDAPWIAHRLIRLNSDIKADRKYKNTRDLKPNMSMEDFFYSYFNIGVDRAKFREQYRRATGQERPQAIFNELWEIHDRRALRVLVVCKDSNSFLRDDLDYVALVAGVPFVTGSYVEHPRCFWCTPLAYYLGQLQATQYDISTQQEKQRRISILKFIAAANFMKPEKLQKLLSGNVGAVEFAEMAEVKDKIVPVPTGNLLDFTLQTNANRQDARSIIGLSRNQAGEFDVGTRRTKGEALLVAMGAQRRESPRVQMVRDLYLETMEKVNRVVFAFWQTPRSVLTDSGWKRFTGDEIAGDYLYELSLTAKRDISKAERKTEAIMMLMHLMPLLQAGAPPQIMEYLANAANDPAFEKLIGFTRGGSKGANAPQMPKGAENAGL